MNTFNVDGLSDLVALKALSDVTEQWFSARGMQANGVLRLTEKYAARQNLSIPKWATGEAEPSPEAGAAAKFALKALLESDDEEIRSWAQSAISKNYEVKAHIIDPLSIGLILGGLILAARVESIGRDGIKFYQGIPKELADVLKAGASFFGHFGG